MDQDASQLLVAIDHLGNGYTTLAGLVGTPLVLWSVLVATVVLAYSYSAAGGTWAWSFRRLSASIICLGAGVAIGMLTAQAAIQRFHLDAVVATYAARRTEACQNFEKAIAEGKVLSLSRYVVDDILRQDCNYLRLMIASEQPGSRIRFVRRYEPGGKGAQLDYNIGVPR